MPCNAKVAYPAFGSPLLGQTGFPQASKQVIVFLIFKRERIKS